MAILQIEHPVSDFASWKKAFDSDPIDRKHSGVRRYRILRPVDDPKYIAVDLEFASIGEAEACLASLRKLWTRVDHPFRLVPAMTQP
jgi:hypothetical protein